MLSDQSSPRDGAGTERYRVGNLEVDVQVRRVIRDGKEVHLTELSFDVLVALLRRAPAIVSKKALMRDVWPGIVVEPDTVKKRIALLRSSLDDVDPAESLIRVARGRGYSINAKVERLDFVTPTAQSPRRRQFTIFLATSALVLSFLAIGLTLRPWSEYATQSPEPRTTSARENASGSEQKKTGTNSPGINEIDPVAYNYYLNGKALRRTSHDLSAASIALEQAIDIEPHFAAALAELALCRIIDPYNAETGQLDSPEGSRELAQRALRLNPTLPEAVAAAAAVAIFLDWNWNEANALLEQGLLVSPGNEYLLSYRAILKAIRGDLRESIRILKSVVAHDVTYARLHYSLGQRYYQAGRLREAIEAYRQALVISPEIQFAHLGIGRIRSLQGDHSAAIREMNLEPNLTFRHYGLAIAHTAAGNETEAIAALEDFENVGGNCCNYWLGTLNAYRGDLDAAFNNFGSAFTGREFGLLDLKIDPLLEGIRDDPRYAELLARMDLD